MSFYTTIASKIEAPKTLIALLNGSAGIYMQNESFPVASGSIKNAQPIFTYKEIKGKSKNGASFIAPRVFIKNDRGEFTGRYKIELTNRFKHKETYRFKTPPMEAYPGGKGKQKNTITTKILDDEGQIDALIILDNIICMGLEFLMLASMAKYNFKDAKDDKELIEGLFKQISPTHYNKLIELLDEEYYNIPTKPPIWEKSSGTQGNFTLSSVENGKYLSLFNVITGTDIHKVKKNFNELQADILKNLFENDRKTNPYYTFICSTIENNIVPTIKKYAFETPEGETKELTDMRLLFFVKHDNDTYNPKFPENLYVKKLIRGGSSEILDGNEFNQMIGVTNYDPTKPNIYDGFIWITNRIDLTKYGQYQVHSSWMVNEVILKKSNASLVSEFNVTDDYYDGLGDDDGTETIATESRQKIASVSEIPNDLDVDEL